MCVYVCIYLYVYHYVYHRNYIYLLMFYSHFERKKLKNLQSGPFTCGQAWLQHSSGCLPKNGRVFRCVAKENEESDPYGYNFIFFICVSHIKNEYLHPYIYICICMYVYNIIQLRTNPMSLQRPKQLKTAGFCSVLNLHPCFFSKSCSTGTQETCPSPYWSQGVQLWRRRWHSDQWRIPFIESNPKFVGDLAVQRSGSKDLNIFQVFCMSCVQGTSGDASFAWCSQERVNINI